MREPGHHVYVVTTTNTGRHIAPVKIGITTDLKNRLRAFRNACPFEVGVAFAFTVRDRLQARTIERVMLDGAEQYRLRGEWLNLAPVYAVNMLATVVEFVRVPPRTPMCSRARQTLCDQFGVTAALAYCEQQMPGFLGEAPT